MHLSYCCIPWFIEVFLDDFSVMPGHVFSKPCLISLRILSVVGLNSAACKYWVSYGFEICARMLLTTFSYFCGSRGTSHIPVFLFLVPFIISSPFSWIDISFLSSMMVHPSSHKTLNNINWAVWILVKFWIYLACSLRPGSWSVTICVDYILLPSGSLDFISFSIITGSIVGVACLDMCIFAPESTIYRMLVLVGLSGL